MIRKRIFTLATAAALTAGTLVGNAGVAEAASYPVDMHHACKLTTGVAGAYASLSYPSQGAWGWRCVIPTGGQTSVNVQLYCDLIYGNDAHALDPSNPYSWRCED